MRDDAHRSLGRTDTDLSRRSFLQRVGTTAAVVGGAGGSLLGSLRPSFASPRPLLEKKPAESYVAQLFESLKPEQRKAICMPFDHDLRKVVKNNWHIVDANSYAIGKFYDSDQQELIRQILKGVTSEDGFERFEKQMKDDAGGLGSYTCAIFGDPADDGKCEFVLTGRHVTLRADGDSVANTAFGGPIFYGHAVEANEKPDHAGNVWWHQSRVANKVYDALDGKQRETALQKYSPDDEPAAVDLRSAEDIPGIAGADLSADQKKLLDDSLRSLLGMFREDDVDEVMSIVNASGGIDALRMSFYTEGNIGGDEIWDRWKVEGPTFAWYFRGTPHVHTYVRIAGPREAAKAEGETATARVRL